MKLLDCEPSPPNCPSSPSFTSLNVECWCALSGSVSPGWTRSLIWTPSWPISTTSCSRPWCGFTGLANLMGAGEWESRWPIGTRSGRPLGGSEMKGRTESGSGGGGREGAGWKGESVGSWILGEETLSSNYFQSLILHHSVSGFHLLGRKSFAHCQIKEEGSIAWNLFHHIFNASAQNKPRSE